MRPKLHLDAVLVQAVIAGALSFAHLHDIAEAAGQQGWKAWAYPVSVDLLFVAAWRRLRTLRADHQAARPAWTWFVIALAASLGANIATAGLLDLTHVPAWLRILVAGWPALAFLGGTLLAHNPVPTTEPMTQAESASEPVTIERASEPSPVELPAPEPDQQAPAAVEEPQQDPEPQPEPAPVPKPVPSGPVVPPALLDHARRIADTHRTATGVPIDSETLRARLGLPPVLAEAITAQLV
ncbi:DUF2637 domain-containing protein [Streptomyces noursei]|uniref:DUF2637 domain-containing protein n=1 Tax=Streptomyces noursei TaxID=1971 RepID=UPI0016759185|nr:DUF2637 domain-containing protein [Streptomyces noursei]MCZ1016313.1 DUF2637 domain-containing protein [Streptomyces noursei]GGX00614.1 SpdA2 protein [Streptomyces noursei]